MTTVQQSCDLDHSERSYSWSVPMIKTLTSYLPSHSGSQYDKEHSPEVMMDHYDNEVDSSNQRVLQPNSSNLLDTTRLIWRKSIIIVFYTSSQLLNFTCRIDFRGSFLTTKDEFIHSYIRFVLDYTFRSNVTGMMLLRTKEIRKVGYLSNNQDCLTVDIILHIQLSRLVVSKVSNVKEQSHRRNKDMSSRSNQWRKPSRSEVWYLHGIDGHSEAALVPRFRKKWKIYLKTLIKDPNLFHFGWEWTGTIC